MSYVQRELDKIAAALQERASDDKFHELLTAQQALAWALDPTFYRAPTDAILGAPLLPSTDTLSG